jgi:hypothetical protein
MSLNKSVQVHSCRINKKDRYPRKLLVSGDLYIGDLGVGIGEQEWYYPLPKSCRCKRYVTVGEATEFVEQGRAVWILQFRRRKGEVVLNEEVSTKIWLRVEEPRVPRVDMISKADVERAFIGSERKSAHYIFNPIKKKFVTVRTLPKGFTAKDWAEEAEEENKFEKNHKERFIRYIEDCHDISMGFRAQLMVPFSPDPFEGRVLFPFGPETRTFGGVGKIKLDF